MSVASDIRRAVIPFGYPVAQNSYTGTEKTYFVFYINTFPADFADDMPQHERQLVQLHLFAPLTLNTTELQREVKRALFGSGFTWPVKENASDDTAQHIVFECEAVEGVN